MTTYFQYTGNAIKTLHHRYGVGDVKAIRISADGRVELTAQGYGMKPHVRRGRLTHNGIKTTIKMYRHQITFVEVGEVDK